MLRTPAKLPLLLLLSLLPPAAPFPPPPPPRLLRARFLSHSPESSAGPPADASTAGGPAAASPPLSLAAQIARQGAEVRRLKETLGLKNRDPAVIAAVQELVLLKEAFETGADDHVLRDVDYAAWPILQDGFAAGALPGSEVAQLRAAMRAALVPEAAPPSDYSECELGTWRWVIGGHR